MLRKTGFDSGVDGSLLHMVLDSSASGCLFGHPNPEKEPFRTPRKCLCGISKNLNLKLIIEFFHLLIIPMTLFNDIMPYFDEFIHVYGWNMSILWSPLKIWTPQNFTTANFRHPVSKCWLRHCFYISETIDSIIYISSITTLWLFWKWILLISFSMQWHFKWST